MITELSDLEPLLGRYEPGVILVGPVLGFSMGDYRYFYVAGSGSKVYETIGLGVFENGAEVESQRANIIAILKSRFKEILTFGSHYAMARAANARWPNEETAQALALATFWTESEPCASARDGTIDDNSHAQVVPGDYGQQLVDDVARELVVAGPPGSGDRPATSSSATFSAGDGPATPQQGHSGYSDEDVAAVFRALRPSYQSQSARKRASRHFELYESAARTVRAPGRPFCDNGCVYAARPRSKRRCCNR